MVSISSGSVFLHLSVVYEHLGLKRHPGGMFMAEETSPLSSSVFFFSFGGWDRYC